MAIGPKRLAPVAGFLGRRALALVESAGESAPAREIRDRLEGAIEQLPQRAVRRLSDVAYLLHIMRPAGIAPGATPDRVPETLQATGVVFPDPQTTAPISHAAAAAWLTAASGYGVPGDAMRGELRRTALRLWHHPASGAVDDAAALAELVRIARGEARAVLVERQDAEARLGGLPLPEFLRSRGFSVSELGDTTATDVDDYRRMLSDRPHGVVVVMTDRGDFVQRLQRLRRSVPASSPIIVWARQSWPADPQVRNYAPATVGGLLRAGATAVLMPTAQLLAGPSGALAILPLRWIKDFQGSQPGMSPADSAATIAAIELWRQPDGCAEIPLVRALRRDPRNVRTRATQLALQLNGSPTIACATAEETETRLFADPASDVFASTRLRIRHAVRPASRWARFLTERHPRLLVSVDGDAILLDLKLIDPENDAQLAALLLEQKHDG